MTNAERNRIVVKKYPWYRVYKRIMARCCKGGQYYGKIKVRIGVDELKKIWFRDKAWLLKKPSIDRIDSAKDYTFENCRFIELSDNQRWNGRPLKCIKCGKKHHALIFAVCII
jgi:hypothetical protein